MIVGYAHVCPDGHMRPVVVDVPRNHPPKGSPMPDAREQLRAAVADAEAELNAYRSAATDLDETRRLLYMALVVGRTSKHSLAGTLINALVHHNLKLDRDETINNVVAAIEGDNEQWVLETIDALTERLDS